MARNPAPCGSFAAYQRHKRNGEDVDDACAQAARDQKNVRADAAQAAAGAAVAEAFEVEPGVDDLDPLEEARDNLRIIRAALRSGPPPNTVAALTKRRDEVVDRIRQIMAETPEVSAFDQLAAKRAARRGAEATG
jgi:hypothetical protein